RPIQPLGEDVDLDSAPDEPREAARGGRLEATSGDAAANQLEHLDGVPQPLDGHPPEGGDLDLALGEFESVGSDQGRPGASELLQPTGEVTGLADRRVVDMQVAADRADHNLPGIQPYANLDIEALAPPELLGVVADRLLHPQRRIAGADRMVL